MIVDCHTHWGVGWAEKHGDDPSVWLRTLDHHGIDRAFLCGHAGLHRLDLCRTDNECIARVTAKEPDRFVPFGSCWPHDDSVGVEEARRCLTDLGMAGVKLHPWLQGFSVASAATVEICRLAGRHDAPVMFHDGTPCYSLSEQIAGLARRVPETRIILGHSGLMWNWRSALEAARLPNVWLCLCGPHLRAIQTVCERVDTTRILWGSDYGFGFADCIDYRLNLLRRAGISAALQDHILDRNPLAVLSLQPSGDRGA